MIRRIFAALLSSAWLLAPPVGAAPAAEPPPSRVEARSSDLLIVGVVHDDKMSIHLSRLIDNAAVRDATVAVLLRGTAHPALAESDGGYSLQSPDLALPGAAAVEFQVIQGDVHETLKGKLEGGSAASPEDEKNTARQLWWWVLNFAVCIGFLLLISRRRKAAAKSEAKD